MTDLTTAAGLRMLDDYFDLQRDSGPQVYAAIHAIEEEAAAAERARIVDAVGRMPSLDLPGLVSRSAVIAAIEGQR